MMNCLFFRFFKSAVRNGFVVAMFIIFLGIFPFLALAFCCWYCCRDRHQRMQLWAKIMGGPKLSLPYVFISSVMGKIRKLVHRWLKTAAQPSPYCPPPAAGCESIDSVSIEKQRPDIHYPRRAEERLQNADDPSQGAKEKKVKKEKSRDIRVEVITVQSTPKVKVKSFGVASERLITEHIDISPVSTPEVRSASASPKFPRRVNDPGSPKPKRDFRNWVKDQVHLKIPSFKRSASEGGGSYSGASVSSPAVDPTVATASSEMSLSLPQE
jgi:hypothetical protein